MEQKYVIPASTMITSISLYVILFVINIFFTLPSIMVINTIAALFIAGLTVYSGFVCRKVGGPKAGNLARFIFLLVYAALAFWQIGTVASIIFLVMSLFPLILFFAGELKPIE